jgi:hypothetical protein
VPAPACTRADLITLRDAQRLIRTVAVAGSDSRNRTRTARRSAFVVRPRTVGLTVSVPADGGGVVT